MANLNKNFDAVYDYIQCANVINRNTVIVIRAQIQYYDIEAKMILYQDEADVLIDTTQGYKVSIPSLSNSNQCFGEFSTRFQEFAFKDSVLSISGTSNGLKHKYIVTLT